MGNRGFPRFSPAFSTPMRLGATLAETVKRLDPPFQGRRITVPLGVGSDLAKDNTLENNLLRLQENRAQLFDSLERFIFAKKLKYPIDKEDFMWYKVIESDKYPLVVIGSEQRIWKKSRITTAAPKTNSTPKDRWRFRPGSVRSYPMQTRNRIMSWYTATKIVCSCIRIGNSDG
jgi:hypothetical protein